MRAVITFHSVDDSGDILSCSIKSFEHLLKTLAKKNIPILPLHSLLSDSSKPGVALTFDDGMQSIFSNALPVMQHYNATSHLFLTPGLIEKREHWPDPAKGVGSYAMLSWGELDQLQKHGVLIESHTQSHPNVRDLTVDQLDEECCNADEIIQQRTGRAPEYFAYPFGCHNKKSRDYISQRYKAAFTTELKYLEYSDHAAIPRIDSYYFDRGYLGQRLIENIDSIFGRNYIKLRCHLRNIKASQTLPDAA